MVRNWPSKTALIAKRRKIKLKCSQLKAKRRLSLAKLRVVMMKMSKKVMETS